MGSPLKQKSSKWKPGACSMRAPHHFGVVVSIFKKKKLTFFFFKLVLYICEMRAGAGMRSEGSVQLRFALVTLLTMCSREPACGGSSLSCAKWG